MNGYTRRNPPKLHKDGIITMHEQHNRIPLLRAALALLAAVALGLSFPAPARADMPDMPRAPELERIDPVVAEPAGADGALGLRSDGRVSDSFFNGTLFVGDSVTLKLERYVRQQRQEEDPDLLGKSKFFCAGSLGSGNLQEQVSKESLHPSLKGKKMLLEDAVAASGAKKVYIMLGMNDLAVYGIDGSVENMMKLLASVRSQSPEVEIYVESATPRIRGKDQKTLNNANLEKYNEALCEAVEGCGQPGIYFVDVASALRGEDGALPLKYCSDPEGQGIHFTDEACRIWIDYLYTHTPG